jgi:hypothetical protein
MGMSGFLKSTLEQWRSFVAVVDSGGYAQAAEHLHNSQSALPRGADRLIVAPAEKPAGILEIGRVE